MENPEIFISYAWGGNSENMADEMYAVLTQAGYPVIRDKIHLGYKGNIKEFMQRIGQGSAIVVIISDKYLRSPNCMYEIVQIQQNGQLTDRIYPIVLPDANIYRPQNRLMYVEHWEKEVRTLNTSMKGIENMALIAEIQQELIEYNQILNAISGITTLFKNTNTLTPEMLRDVAYKPLVDAIKKQSEVQNSENMIFRKVDMEYIHRFKNENPVLARKMDIYLVDLTENHFTNQQRIDFCKSKISKYEKLDEVFKPFIKLFNYLIFALETIESENSPNKQKSIKTVMENENKPHGEPQNKHNSINVQNSNSGFYMQDVSNSKINIQVNMNNQDKNQNLLDKSNLVDVLIRNEFEFFDAMEGLVSGLTDSQKIAYYGLKNERLNPANNFNLVDWKNRMLMFVKGM